MRHRETRSNQESSCPRLLIHHRVDQKSEPEALEKMENQSFSSVQKTEPHEVAVRPIRQGSDEQGASRVNISPPAAALNGISHDVRRDLLSTFQRREKLASFH